MSVNSVTVPGLGLDTDVLYVMVRVALWFLLIQLSVRIVGDPDGEQGKCVEHAKGHHEWLSAVTGELGHHIKGRWQFVSGFLCVFLMYFNKTKIAQRPYGMCDSGEVSTLLMVLSEEPPSRFLVIFIQVILKSWIPILPPSFLPDHPRHQGHHCSRYRDPKDVGKQ